MGRNSHSSTIECEYIVGDDSCQAVKQSDMIMLRRKLCHNEIKDACCYSCELRGNCEIGCDMLNGRKDNAKPKRMGSRRVAVPLGVEVDCGNCLYYLKAKCPRDYGHDDRLWRRQDVCEIFKPKKA